MSAPFKLPPSERDFEVFFAVVFHSVSTRRVAELHQISQTRVRQLVMLVGDWVADNLPDWGEADLKKQVRLAQHVAANRLEHQHEQAMLRWNIEGDPKYLRQAARIVLAQARLGVVAGRVHALAADVTEGPSELGDSHRGAGVSPASADKSPIDGDVSPSADRIIESSYGRRDACPTPSPNGDCSLADDQTAGGEPSANDDFAASDSGDSRMERERQRELVEVQGAALIERRLLSLIEVQGDDNPDKVASLQETLARVRREKAAAELRLSRFIHGVQIEPLNVQPQTADTNVLAAS
jgi:hypothetical protein